MFFAGFHLELEKLNEAKIGQPEATTFGEALVDLWNDKRKKHVVVVTAVALASGDFWH